MGFAAASEPAFALGHQFLPHLPVGFALAPFEAFGQFGIEGSLNAGGSEDGPGKNREVLHLAGIEPLHPDSVSTRASPSAAENARLSGTVPGSPWGSAILGVVLILQPY